MLCAIWYHFLQIKKREKHPWRNVTFSKVAELQACFTKRILLYGCFSRFLYFSNGAKSRNASLWKLTASDQVILDTELK